VSRELHGMPFLLSGSVLTYWMATEKVDLTTIGIFGLVGLPYALKFAWAPLVDRMPLPLIDRWLGRRRSWMLLTQVGILLSTLLLALSNPVEGPWLTAFAAVLVAFFSATQDIAIDAYRIEILNDDEQGAGAATTQLGYRIALWIVDALALLLPSFVPWPVVLSAIAGLAVVGIVTTFVAEEPRSSLPAPDSALRALIATGRPSPMCCPAYTTPKPPSATGASTRYLRSSSRPDRPSGSSAAASTIAATVLRRRPVSAPTRRQHLQSKEYCHGCRDECLRSLLVPKFHIAS